MKTLTKDEKKNRKTLEITTILCILIIYCVYFIIEYDY